VRFVHCVTIASDNTGVMKAHEDSCTINAPGAERGSLMIFVCACTLRLKGFCTSQNNLKGGKGRRDLDDSQRSCSLAGVIWSKVGRLGVVEFQV
jgi:hypothetical protein